MNDSVKPWLAKLRATRLRTWIITALLAVPWLTKELLQGLAEHWFFATILEWLKEPGRLTEFKLICLWLVDHLWLLPVVMVSGILVHTYLFRAESATAAISAKYVRKEIMDRNAYGGIAAKLIQNMGKRSSAVPFDLLLEIHAVNITNHVRTIQRIDAEAEIENKWMPLRESDLSRYEIAFDEDKKLAVGGLRDVMARKEPLASLSQKLRGVALHQGIGIQGWVSFEMIAGHAQLVGKETKFKVFLVDSMEGKHLVQTIDALHPEGRITYSQSAILQMHQ